MIQDQVEHRGIADLPTLITMLLEGCYKGIPGIHSYPAISCLLKHAATFLSKEDNEKLLSKLLYQTLREKENIFLAKIFLDAGAKTTESHDCIDLILTHFEKEPSIQERERYIAKAFNN